MAEFFIVAFYQILNFHTNRLECYLGVDADAARREEEDMMMEDANQWLNSAQKGETVEELTHPKTGATALHVASAKGYVKVIA